MFAYAILINDCLVFKITILGLFIEVFCKECDCSDCHLELWRLPVHHQPLKFRVLPGVAGDSREAFDGAQRLPHRVLPISRELVVVGRGVGEHDLARQGGDFGRIVVLTQRVKIMQVADKCRVRLVDQAGQLGAGGRVSATNLSAAVSTIDVHSIFATSGGRCKASATNEITGSSTAGR